MNTQAQIDEARAMQVKGYAYVYYKTPESSPLYTKTLGSSPFETSGSLIGLMRDGPAGNRGLSLVDAIDELEKLALLEQY